MCISKDCNHLQAFSVVLEVGSVVDGEEPRRVFNFGGERIIVQEDLRYSVSIFSGVLGS